MKNTNSKEIYWKDIELGAKFFDDSVVTEIHSSIIDDCYAISYKIPLSINSKIKRFPWQKVYSAVEVRKLIGSTDITVLGKDHLWLIDISKIPKEKQVEVNNIFAEYQIPTEWNRHVYYKDEVEMSRDEIFAAKQIKDGEHLSEIIYNNSIEEKMEIAKADPAKVSETEYWLPVSYIHRLIQDGYKLICNNHILDSMFIGQLEAFCVGTDVHKYEVNGLIHHNSVLLQNIIFHTLTHGSDMAIALVDLKFTEFSQYKNFKNVVAVANSVREARELMLIARRVMDKRNQEMSKLGLKDMMNQRPTDFTGEVIVSGRKLQLNDEVEIRTVKGEMKKVTVQELENYLEWDLGDEK